MTRFTTCECDTPVPGANKSICSKCNGIISTSIIEKSIDLVDELTVQNMKIQATVDKALNRGFFKWADEEKKDVDTILHGDLRIVTLPVQVVFEWSEEIVKDYDEETGDIEYTSGWVMKVLPQTIVYKNEHTFFVAQTNKDG